MKHNSNSINQIVKSKTKNSKKTKVRRRAKSDLTRQRRSPSPPPRRSSRSRKLRYNFDYLDDDFIDDVVFDDFDDDDEDERRREKKKKLKLVLKLNQDEPDNAARPASDEEDEDDDDEEEKPLKKRRINGGGVDDGEESEENEVHGMYDEEERDVQKVELRVTESTPGTPVDQLSGLPLPDKKTLDLILDKLQKKDTYGVYAEPVDQEELPDYHDVIDHPMDFATVRKKLANGSYATLEQFESDVFLICSNAMQYNASDTIYHKQAYAIQELAKRKFEKLRLDIERSSELKSEPRMKSNFMVKKQTKKPLGWTSQEPVGSDFSSGATLATAADALNNSIRTQLGGCERPINNDGHVEANASIFESNFDRADEFSSGKGILPKMGRKVVVPDENRRDTYNISNQPVVRSESVYTTFEGEIKQLLAVGLHTEFSYARSLARFAASLGPVAWKVASQRVEKTLPAGCKYGRGWVGEYEPLPTPVLMIENYSQKDCPLLKKPGSNAKLMKDEKINENQNPCKEHQVTGPALGGKAHLFSPPGGPFILEGKHYLFNSGGPAPTASVNDNHQQHNSLPKGYAEAQNKVPKQMELNSLPSSSQNAIRCAEKHLSGNSEMRASRSGEMASKKLNLQPSVPSNNPNTNGRGSGGLTNRNNTNNHSSNRVVSPPTIVHNQLPRAAPPFSHGQPQGLSDPVKLMRMLAENSHQQQQQQQKSSAQSSVNIPQSMPSVPSTKREDPNSAAARAWMSVGAVGFTQATESNVSKTQIPAESCNPTRGLHLQNLQARGEIPASGGLQSQSEKNGFPFQAFVPQPVHMGNAALFQNRSMAFPQAITADLSRFQVQFPWQVHSPQTQLKQKQETLPPDLNIGFNSPGSPAKQSSSGAVVDSQQPDLALQL